jgi:hypothetical protein
VPENAARKKRARLLSRITGMPYAACITYLDRHRDRPHLLWSAEDLQRFGRPVGIITRPVLPGPWGVQRSAFNDLPYAIGFSYGSTGRPDARIGTHYAIPGQDQPDPGPLWMELANFATRRTAPQTRERDIAVAWRRDTFSRHRHALEAAPGETVEVLLCGNPIIATRLSLDGLEVIEIHHDDATIVCCGAEGLAEIARLDYLTI